MRLDRYLSECLQIPRSRSRALLAAGRVCVDGRVCTAADRQLAPGEAVTADGAPLAHSRCVYLMLNKPAGVVSASRDAHDTTVVDLVQGAYPRRSLFPAGRLDKASTGFVLLTDDGVFANAMMHPKHHVPKVYRVSVRPAITGQQVKRLENGIEIDGRVTAPALVQVVTHEEERSVIEITLFEGRNREIRRMCAELGLKVGRLSRIAIGNLRLGGLRPGDWRELEPREVSSLMRLSGVIMIRKREDIDRNRTEKK